MARKRNNAKESCHFASDPLAHLARSQAGSDEIRQQFFDNWISKKDLAQHLGVSESSITRLMYEDGLPYLKMRRTVRFKLSEVQSWFQKRGMKL